MHRQNLKLNNIFKKMTKADIVNEIARATGLEKADVLTPLKNLWK